jgi:hypothetical protein
VLKPNRGYGGEGVLVGPAVAEADWEAALSHALVDTDQRWVVEALAVVPIVDFPVFDGGGVGEEPFFVVMGFVPSQYGLGVLARRLPGSRGQRGPARGNVHGRDRLAGPRAGGFRTLM